MLHTICQVVSRTFDSYDEETAPSNQDEIVSASPVSVLKEKTASESRTTSPFPPPPPHAPPPPPPPPPTAEPKNGSPPATLCNENEELVKTGAVGEFGDVPPNQTPMVDPRMDSGSEPTKPSNENEDTTKRDADIEPSDSSPILEAKIESESYSSPFTTLYPKHEAELEDMDEISASLTIAEMDQLERALQALAPTKEELSKLQAELKYPDYPDNWMDLLSKKGDAETAEDSHQELKMSPASMACRTLPPTEEIVHSYNRFDVPLGSQDISDYLHLILRISQEDPENIKPLIERCNEELLKLKYFVKLGVITEKWLEEKIHEIDEIAINATEEAWYANHNKKGINNLKELVQRFELTVDKIKFCHDTITATRRALCLIKMRGYMDFLDELHSKHGEIL